MQIAGGILRTDRYTETASAYASSGSGAIHGTTVGSSTNMLASTPTANQERDGAPMKVQPRPAIPLTSPLSLSRRGYRQPHRKVGLSIAVRGDYIRNPAMLQHQGNSSSLLNDFYTHSLNSSRISVMDPFSKRKEITNLSRRGARATPHCMPVALVSPSLPDHTKAVLMRGDLAGEAKPQGQLRLVSRLDDHPAPPGHGGQRTSTSATTTTGGTGSGYARHSQDNFVAEPSASSTDSANGSVDGSSATAPSCGPAQDPDRRAGLPPPPGRRGGGGEGTASGLADAIDARSRARRRSVVLFAIEEAGQQRAWEGTGNGGAAGPPKGGTHASDSLDPDPRALPVRGGGGGGGAFALGQAAQEDGTQRARREGRRILAGIEAERVTSAGSSPAAAAALECRPLAMAREALLRPAGASHCSASTERLLRSLRRRGGGDPEGWGWGARPVQLQDLALLPDGALVTPSESGSVGAAAATTGGAVTGERGRVMEAVRGLADVVSAVRRAAVLAQG